MATQKKSATDTIVTVSGRKDLLPRHAPYFQKLRHQCHLGFRKTTADSHGAWIARYGDASGKYEFHSLGSLESVIANRRYDEAVKLATEWFDYRSGGGLKRVHHGQTDLRTIPGTLESQQQAGWGQG